MSNYRSRIFTPWAMIQSKEMATRPHAYTAKCVAGTPKSVHESEAGNLGASRANNWDYTVERIEGAHVTIKMFSTGAKDTISNTERTSDVIPPTIVTGYPGARWPVRGFVKPDAGDYLTFEADKDCTIHGFVLRNNTS